MTGEAYSFAVPTTRIPAAGKHFRIESSEEQRRSIAKALGIVAVEALRAELEVRPVGAETFAVNGRLSAAVVQTDVVTLEPVRQNVEETIDLMLAPAKDESPPKRRTLEPLDAESAEDLDVYRGGRIDLGIIVYEHLALGLDPYPKAPGVEFSGHIEDDPASAPSAFAALASLKRDQD